MGEGVALPFQVVMDKVPLFWWSCFLAGSKCHSKRTISDVSTALRGNSTVW